MADATTLAVNLNKVAKRAAKAALNSRELYVSLQDADQDAKNLNKKIRLVSKALEQIELRLKDAQSFIDWSLVDDYIEISDERLDQAEQLMSILERELHSDDARDRIRSRVRFVLERSTFALLPHDMDSLQITLNLYLTILKYRRSNRDAETLTEIREQLTDAMEEVRHDLEDHPPSMVLKAAMLTAQYHDGVPTTLQRDASSSKLPALADDLEAVALDTRSRQEERGSENINLGESSSSIIQDGQIPSIQNNEYIPLSLIESEIVGKALASFTQIQLLQRKTLRRATNEIERETEPRPPPAYQIVQLEGGDSNTLSPVGHQTMRRLSVSRELQSRDGDSLSEGRSSFIDVPSPSLRAVSPGGNSVHLRSTDTKTALLLDNVEPSAPSAVSREKLASQYIGQYFGVLNSKNGKVSTINFSFLKERDLHNIILDIYTPYLQYSAPLTPTPAAPGSKTTSAASTTPHQRHPFQAPLYYKGESSQWKQKLKPGSAARVSFKAFAAYVLTYAKWYTDDRRLEALRHQSYHLAIDSVENTFISMETWTNHLHPGDIIGIVYSARDLTAENMIEIRDKDTGIEYMFVDGGPYIQCLEILCSEGNYEKLS